MLETTAVIAAGRTLEHIMTTGLKWTILTAAVMPAQAQITEQVRRATGGGSRGTSGKCAIELRVAIPNFRLNRIHGRGNVSPVRAPRDNNSMAVILTGTTPGLGSRGVYRAHAR